MNNYFLLASVFDATMTLQEFFLILLWIALIVFIIMLCTVVFTAFQTLKDIRKIVKDNSENINLILNEVPTITKNVQEISAEASHAARVIRPTVDNVADTAQSITGTLKENNPVNEAIVSAYKTVNNVHKLVDSVGNKADKQAKKVKVKKVKKEEKPKDVE